MLKPAAENGNAMVGLVLYQEIANWVGFVLRDSKYIVKLQLLGIYIMKCKKF